MTCGGHGRCRADRGRPLCDCFFGFRPSLNQTTCLSGKLSCLTDYYNKQKDSMVENTNT